MRLDFDVVEEYVYANNALDIMTLGKEKDKGKKNGRGRGRFGQTVISSICTVSLFSASR